MLSVVINLADQRLGCFFSIDLINIKFHMEFHTILQGFELCLPCLNMEFGLTENLLDVLTKYEILGFCGLSRHLAYAQSRTTWQESSWRLQEMD